jgi:septal ring factor EnvC (AmiA/AmiB activator)
MTLTSEQAFADFYPDNMPDAEFVDEDDARLIWNAAWSDQQWEIDRLTRALTEMEGRYETSHSNRMHAEKRLAEVERELSEANEKIARLTEEMERDRRIVAAHAKCDPKECTVIVGLSIVHGHMPTEPHADLTTPTEEKE